jgi:ribosome-binding protein aMBF1 (putative translation factor)
MEDGAWRPFSKAGPAPVCGAMARVIRARREAAGLSLGGLAARSGVSRQMLGFIEAGKRVPTIDSIARIGHGLGVRGTLLLAEAEGVECGDMSPLWDCGTCLAGRKARTCPRTPRGATIVAWAGRG